MFRCSRQGCPYACGSRHRPSCLERTLYYALYVLLIGVFLFSLGTGLVRLNNSINLV